MAKPEERVLFRMLDLVGRSPFHALIYKDAKTGEHCNTNIAIFPEIYQTDDCVIDVIYNNQQGVKYEDRGNLEFIFSVLSTEEVLETYTDKPPMTLQLHLNNGNDSQYISYNFIISVFNINGHLEILARVSKEIGANDYIRFVDYVTEHMYKGNLLQCIVQLDIKGFKLLNRQYGEVYCDELLAFISTNLLQICGGQMKFVHYYNDVYLIFLECAEGDQIEFVLKCWERCLKGYGDKSYDFSWGVYVCDKNNQLTCREVIDRAAIACQSIKKNAVSNIAFFDEIKCRDLYTVYDIENNMQQALNNGEFKVFVQPKYDMLTGQIVGGEALLRWLKNGVYLSPGLFIPIFERNRFITCLDRFVWEEVCKLIKELKCTAPISVNVSRAHFCDGLSFIDFLDSLVEKYDIDKSLLQLEITESVDAEIKSALHELKARGYILLMDDFGSGYSSLNVLRDSPFDIIKLDMGFLENFCSNSKGRKILVYVMSMLKDLGTGVIAEGVETAEQRDFLIGTGCMIAQGYLFSKPVHVWQFKELLEGQEVVISDLEK